MSVLRSTIFKGTFFVSRPNIILRGKRATVTFAGVPVVDLSNLRSNGGTFAFGELIMDYERESIPESLRTAVFERDHYRCRYCGAGGVKLCLDHVYPVSRGGETTFANLVTACVPCNLRKSGKVGIWPRPVDYLEMRRHIIGLQRETDEVLFGLEIFILTQMHKIRDAEGRLGFLDIGRIALKYNIDLFAVCDFLDRQTNVHPTIRRRIEMRGLEKYLDAVRLHDAQCKKPLLEK